MVDVDNLDKKGKDKDRGDKEENRSKNGNDVTLTPQWVYGIRFKDVKYFIEFISEYEIAYFVGKVVIILNTKSCKQRHYMQHRE